MTHTLFFTAIAAFGVVMTAAELRKASRRAA